MEEFYVGSDLKFKVDITASGFNIAEDDFTIVLVQGNRSKVLHRDDLVAGEDGYYLTVNAEEFNEGIIKMIVSAEVPDDDFEDGSRREVECLELCKINGIPLPPGITEIRSWML